MAVKLSEAIRNGVYNGTHGNLSVIQGKIPAAADGDSVVLLKLEAGVELVELKLLNAGAEVALLKAVASLNEVMLNDGTHEPAIGTKLDDVIVTPAAIGAGTLSSDVEGYVADACVTEKDKYIVVTVSGAAAPANRYYFKAYTKSVGTP